MEKPHLSKVLNFERDISPYPFIALFSGVGSGKNYFVNNLVQGKIPSDEPGQTQHFPAQTILLVTSRRAKANEIRSDKTVTTDKWIGQWDNVPCYYLEDLEDVDDIMEHSRQVDCSENHNLCRSGIQTIYQRYFVCTNAAIEKYMRKKYSPEDNTTHLWNRFDIIVFDEAHAFVADMCYQTAPFYSLALMEDVLEQQKEGRTKCKVMMMTGTPEILQHLPLKAQYHVIDRMKQCCNVTPEHILFIDSRHARKCASSYLFCGERAIFFFNHVSEMLDYYDTLADEDPMLLEQVAFSFSDEERRKKVAQNDPTAFAKMVKVEAHIAEHQLLPDGITIFLTTERNKEGINICNEDISTMFVESHAEVSIVQMVGRLRKGVKQLFVVTDSTQHYDSENFYEWFCAKDGKLVQDFNDLLPAVCKEANVDPNDPYDMPLTQYKKITDYIDFVQEKNPYILYNYSKNRFFLNKLRYTSKVYFRRQNYIFNKAMESEDGLKNLARSWYPGVKVTVLHPFNSQITQYLEDHELLNHEITYDQQQECLEFLNELTGESRKTLRPALKPFGYAFTPKNKHAQCPGVITVLPADEGSRKCA